MVEVAAHHRHPAYLVAVLTISAAVLTVIVMRDKLPPTRWPQAIVAPDTADIRQLVVHYSLLPRLALSIVCGAALGLAGAILQQTLQNPLASPSTLGVSAGAQLAVVAATLWLPATVGWARDWTALAGAGMAGAVVITLAWRQALATLPLVLAGLMVGLYCGSVTAVLVLFHGQNLTGVLIWGGGSLAQQDWRSVTSVVPRILAVSLLMLSMLRPMTVLGLSEDGARSLGLSVRRARILCLAAAVALTAFVTSAVGIIGFIGLVAPALAKMLGARRPCLRLFWSAAIGGTLLWLADELVQVAGGVRGDFVPTGAATALLGAPVLLWIVARTRGDPGQTRQAVERVLQRSERPWLLIAALSGLLAVVVMMALSFGQGQYGWRWSNLAQFEALFPWRAPRIGAAAAVGIALGIAGTCLQRITGNGMASPELLGISAGAAVGYIIVLILNLGASHDLQLAASSAGALVVLIVMVTMGHKSDYQPVHLILIGIAIGTLLDSLVAFIIAAGDPRSGRLLAWMLGSTYETSVRQTLLACVIAVGALAVTPAISRWLDILPLGEPSARSLGVDLVRSRVVILGLTAVLTATATLVVGPLTFVGLMTPHLARLLGLHRSQTQLVAAALLGATIMVGADWLGRTANFPREVPAGLVAALLAGPYVIWRLRRA